MDEDYRHVPPIGQPLAPPEASDIGLGERSADHPPAQRDQVRKARESASGSLMGVRWVLTLLITLLLLTYFIPDLIEKVQFAQTRGRLRAEHQQAGELLPHTSLVDLSTAYQLLSQRVGPTVVNIDTTREDPEKSSHDEAGHLFGDPRRYPTVGQGSGVVIDAKGYILTNSHVIQGADEIIVKLSDGRRLRATVQGVDAMTDLAVLKIKAEGLIAAEWGDSDSLEVGALVWAVGSPFGLERSITSGIVSAKNRNGFTRNPHEDFLQTDAAVNPGNSGGPLVDAQGRVVGINTAIVGQTFQGISFSIPSSIAQDVFQRLVTDGRVARGWLGVALDDVTPARAKRLGLPEDQQGAFVAQVVAGPASRSPAQRAGVKTDDVIIRWGETEIDGPTSLSRIVARTAPGEEIDVVVLREGEEKTLRVLVGERPMQLN